MAAALSPASAAAFVVSVHGKKRTRSTISFHAFRHTCASLLFEAGHNVKQVQAWLGHSDPGFTLSTYIHLMDAGVGNAVFFDEAVYRTQETGGPHVRSVSQRTLEEAH